MERGTSEKTKSVKKLYKLKTQNKHLLTEAKAEKEGKRGGKEGAVATVDQREGILSSSQAVTTDGSLGVDQVFVRSPHVSHNPWD